MTFKELAKSGLVTSFSLPLVKDLASAIASEQALIFMLHRFQDLDAGVEGHDPELVRSFLEELRRKKYNLTSIDEIVDANVKGEQLKNAIAFTIDDGYKDNSEIGGSIFSDYDCPATFYLITDFVGGKYWPLDAKIQYLFESTLLSHIDWRFGKITLKSSLENDQQRKAAIQTVVWSSKELPIHQMQLATEDLATVLEVEIPINPPAKFNAMSWQDAINLERKGMFIGAHTRRHVTLSKENDECAENEIMESFYAVRRNIAKPSKVFCYPTGRRQDFAQRDMDIVKRGGFSGALSAEWGYYDMRNAGGRYLMPRINMPNNVLDFRQMTLYIDYFKRLIRK